MTTPQQPVVSTQQPRLIFFYARMAKPGAFKKPVSIGAVDETGENVFYVENADIEATDCEQYVVKYVMPLLERGSKMMPQKQMFLEFGNWIVTMSKRGNGIPYQIAIESNWETLLLEYGMGARWPRTLRQEHYMMKTDGIAVEKVVTAAERVEEFLKTHSDRHALNQAKAIRILWDALGRPGYSAPDAAAAAAHAEDLRKRAAAAGS